MPNTAYILINEAELFLKLSQGDESAFESIYRHYVKRLGPFVDRMIRCPELAEEVVQDIFVQLWVNRHLLSDVRQPAAYLFNMASNKTLDYIRKIANNDKLMQKVAGQSSELIYDTEERINYNESLKLIEEATAVLPNQRRLIYILSRNEGLSHEQIADKLNISKSTVKNQLVKALKSIKSYLQEHSTDLCVAVFIIINFKD
ncbi:RNA polymerase sigma-70 factor [Mucilaginibacter sp. PAMB04274]|uniref:RNA polymerase sigma factor n=1 Tax=Mucilaginibacter sp. PAMB04274 TaxID=3138568 RepID=UPI0031F6B730